MSIFGYIVVFIVGGAIIKASMESIEDWLDALSPWVEYQYAFFFAYADKHGNNHGFGRTQMTSNRKIDSSDELKEAEKIIRDEKGKAQAVVTSVHLLKKRNRLIPVLAGCVWTVITTIAEGVKLSFTRSADDALNEYLQANDERTGANV